MNMKRLAFFISLIFMSSVVLVAQQERKVNSKAEMAFNTLSHDYGSIVYGADGTYNFKFTNNADKPIVVTNVKSSCGCTVPSWPKEPIQPGKTGNITVKYNTKLSGTFNKTVQVFSTAANSPVKLSVRGKVNARPSDLKSTNKNTQLLNGTRVKEGVANTNAQTQITKEKPPVSAESGISTGGDSKSKYKQAKKQAYQKKIEETKTKKK